MLLQINAVIIPDTPPLWVTVDTSNWEEDTPLEVPQDTGAMFTALYSYTL